MFQTSIRVKDIDNLLEIFGNLDGNISIIEKRLEVTIILRNDEIKITGTKEQNIQNAAKVLTVLSQIKDTITDQTVDYTISMILEDKVEQIKALSQNCIFVTALGKPIKPKTIGQKEYIKAVSNNIITFAVGPAGTGKTYLAVAMAVKALKAGEISRIILTRPAVEAGEKLGFLPGDLQTKVDPYLRPLYDALFDMLGAEGYQRQLEKGVIEIAPLAYMRGRTLDNAFVILDE
ncbi:MAG: PhoH family protein, partial [Oscillospiraceae bacterium]